MRNKQKYIFFIMAAVFLIAVVIIGFALAGSKDRKRKKNINLGQQYLRELNYEQAIATFKQALELDPYSVEAYLGTANAYIGLEDYEMAKSILESGIQVFMQANRNDEADTLKQKLDEVQSILDETEAEKARIAAEEERLAEENQTIVLIPLMDCLNDVWGKSWLYWNWDNFISENGLFELKDRDEYFGNAERYPEIVASRYDDGAVIQLQHLGWHITQYEGGGSGGHSGNNTGIFLYKDGGLSYSKLLQSNVFEPEKDKLYEVAKEYHLMNYEEVQAYLNITVEDLRNHPDGIPIVTDMGPATVGYYENHRENYDEMTISIYFENPEEVTGIAFNEINDTVDGDWNYSIMFHHGW